MYIYIYIYIYIYLYVYIYIYIYDLRRPAGWRSGAAYLSRANLAPGVQVLAGSHNHWALCEIRRAPNPKP